MFILQFVQWILHILHKARYVVAQEQWEYVWKWIAEYVNWKAKPWGGNFFLE